MKFDDANPPLEMQILSPRYLSFLIDTDSDSEVDQALRVGWSEIYYGQYTNQASEAAAPVANAGIISKAWVGHPVTMHALYSHDANRDYLSFHWSLLHKPFGSSVTIADQDASDTEFTPDQAGRYLFTLMTDDGVNRSEVTTEVDVSNVVYGDNVYAVSTERGHIEVNVPTEPLAPILVDASATSSVADFRTQWYIDDPNNTAYFNPASGSVTSDLYIQSQESIKYIQVAHWLYH